MNTTHISPATRSFGYANALQEELARVGQISIAEFERRYADPASGSPARWSGDPLTARYGELFRREPYELLRERIVQALDTLLPKEPGPSVSDAVLQSLFALWDAFEASQATTDEQYRGQWGDEWEAVVEYIAAHPLLAVVARWENWKRERLHALRGLYFAAGSDLLAWLEDDEARRLQEIPQDPDTCFWRFGSMDPQAIAPQALAQLRRGRLHELHQYLTGHYGIHADFRLNLEETALLRQNGFVVTQRLGARSFGDLYYHLFNNDMPVFVTCDSVLHAWHRSYDALLKQVEEVALMSALDDILTGMTRQLSAAQQSYAAGILAESLRDVDFYLAVALSLLRDTAVPTQFAQDERVAAALQACADQQMESFSLFGCERLVDFSQFKPRGHYEQTEALQRYFRAMMWVGRIDLRVAGGDNPWEATQRQLGAALILLDLLRRADRFTVWLQFDHLLQTFVGATDSLTFAQLDRLARQAGIASPIAITEWTQLEDLQAIILQEEGGFQQIASGCFVSDPDLPEQVVLPRSFTLLGQKFTLDSWALGQAVYDRVMWNGEKVARRIPSCLDVAFAALGNDRAVPPLVARMRDENGRAYRDGLPYQHNLAAVRNVVDALDETVWESSLYTRWLHCLRALSTPMRGAEVPQALRSSAWAAKCLNTQMASWTQLRHDTILYVKQSETMVTCCFHPAGYVEPNLLFWERLEKMATCAAELLAEAPYPQPAAEPSADERAFLARLARRSGGATEKVQTMQERQVAFLRRFAETVHTLHKIAARQIEGAERTEEEKKFLQNIVQIVDTHGSGAQRYYNGWYPALFYGSAEKCAEADFLVADVHTDTPSDWPPDPGCVLHQAVGGVDLLVIAIDEGEEPVVFAGPTLSHYEFEMPHATRKADSEWQADLESGHFPPRPSWTQSYLVAENQIPSLVVAPPRDQRIPSLNISIVSPGSSGK
jgi:hypothetical protein